MLFRRKKKLAEIWTYLFCVDFASIVCPTILLKKNQRILVFLSCLHCTKLRYTHSSFVIVVILCTTPPHTMLINMVIFTCHKLKIQLQ
mmetsp:Transcript_25700/g.33558  ORF Transcript_25700/g.33558 Transcript_25700/m.33558 type:complete len:88 (+) Transcript_25700:870-1133(+)